MMSFPNLDVLLLVRGTDFISLFSGAFNNGLGNPRDSGYDITEGLILVCVVGTTHTKIKSRHFILIVN